MFCDMPPKIKLVHVVKFLHGVTEIWDGWTRRKLCRGNCLIDERAQRTMAKLVEDDGPH